MAQLERIAPESIDKAAALCAEYGDRAKIVCGGTDLLVQIKKQVIMPDTLVSLDKVPGLNLIVFDQKDGLSLGALSTIKQIEDSKLVQKDFPVIAMAAGRLGTPLIRRLATLGGNLCSAAPSADMAPALLVSGAAAVIRELKGERTVKIDEFFTGPRETVLKTGDILLRIQVPNPHPKSRGVYLKQTRRHGADLAVVGVAVSLVMEDKLISDIKIGLGAVAPTPIRAVKAEALLKGQSWTPELLEEAGRIAVTETNPIDDVRGSAAYRKKLVAVLVRRALLQTIEME
jgi:CO/xanthine dehydrogenase FAD-binding subunit